MNPMSCGLAGKTKKNTFFKKQSGGVVENTFQWKKQTQNGPKTNPAMVLKINNGQKTNRRMHQEFLVPS
jgi:hypothetical protein